MTRFLIDNQLPSALARWLRERGQIADHVLDLGMGQADDGQIWSYAASTGAAIITKDEDFAQLTILRPEGVRVVWLRVGNCRTVALLATFERLWPEIQRQLESDTTLIEIY